MRLAVLTSGRQDWGILRSTCRLLAEAADFDLRLIVGGLHLRPGHGDTLAMLAEEGFIPCESLDWHGGPEAADRAGMALTMVAEALRRQQPDALLLVGDRYETAAAALAATIERVPLVHLHGGEETLGAIDNVLRHAITKMSHLHLVSHPDHAERLRRMGEDPATVHVVGAPGLDNVHRADLPDREELAADLGRPLEAPLVLVTLHPATLGDDALSEAEAVAAAIRAVPATYVITLPNDDPGHAATRAVLAGLTSEPSCVVVEALGERRYWGMLRICDAMLGNSSSGLIEAPAVALPVVNVGERQRGRLRGANVVDTPAEAVAIAAGLRQALSPAWRSTLHHAPSPYGDGRAAPRIVEALRRWQPPSPPAKAGGALPPS
jgi:UDP-hydrolysing UDP-N-acetyl-D-glucosamine 2-epimerase